MGKPVDLWGGVCPTCDRDIKKGLAETHADLPDTGTSRGDFGKAIRANAAHRKETERLVDGWRAMEGYPADEIRERTAEQRQRRVDWVDERRAKARQRARRWKKQD